jgi:hypothetical protein
MPHPRRTGGTSHLERIRRESDRRCEKAFRAIVLVSRYETGIKSLAQLRTGRQVDNIHIERHQY